MVPSLPDAPRRYQGDGNSSSCCVLENMKNHISKHVKACDRCQQGKKHKLKYEHIPPKLATVVPWKRVCVDCIGSYTVKEKEGTNLDFICLTMNDLAMSWFEATELPNSDITYVKNNGEEITKVIIDKTSTCITGLCNRHWLLRYSRAESVIYDNGTEFKLFFKKWLILTPQSKGWT